MSETDRMKAQRGWKPMPKMPSDSSLLLINEIILNLFKRFQTLGTIFNEDIVH